MSGFDSALPDIPPAPGGGGGEQHPPPEWVGLLLDGLTTALGHRSDDLDTAVSGEPEGVPEPLYDGPEPWVTGWLAPILVRQPTQDFLWCARWWDHPEVLLRITGLWETWEAARLGGATAINDWLATQLDHHLAVITSSSGPLYRCKPTSGDTPGEHHNPAGLGTTPAPQGFFAPPPSGVTTPPTSDGGGGNVGHHMGAADVS